jgi:DUF971 family protein
MSSDPSEVAMSSENELAITWSDGHKSLYPAHYLRENCRCAVCIEELTGRKLLDPSAIPSDIKPLKISYVGRYAIHIQWSDGHSTGIYPFELLRNLCPCADDRKNC